MSEVQDRDEVELSLGKKEAAWLASSQQRIFCHSSSEITWIDYIQLICID